MYGDSHYCSGDVVRRLQSDGVSRSTLGLPADCTGDLGSAEP